MLISFVGEEIRGGKVVQYETFVKPQKAVLLNGVKNLNDLIFRYVKILHSVQDN